MDYIVSIPTTRERSYEILRCLKSIVEGKTRDFPIVVFGQADDPTIEKTWINVLGNHRIIYLGPENVRRLIDYTGSKLVLERNDLNALFNYRTFGGARNLLTAFAFVISKNPGVINIDDDEEVLPGFFEEHIKLLGTKTSKGKKITLVTGPYTNHSSYVGFDTLLYILSRKRGEGIVRDALRAITYATEEARGYVYGINGCRGGNLSRCDSALRIPYISSPEDINLRGEDEIHADLNQIMNPGCINLYTPNAKVKHTKRPGYLLENIKGELIGIIVHEVIRHLELDHQIRENYINLVDLYSRKVLEQKRRQLKQKRFNYSPDIERELSIIVSSVYALLSDVAFFKRQATLYINNLIYGFNHWEKILDCLSNSSEEAKRYILTH
ncbi:MAG: hypothetical protein QXM68_00270 [Candidatus Aenigmatarchaeota archaeon]|nr:hypothetical protein [Candidatus Aenigmarchaeota archaeon]